MNTLSGYKTYVTAGLAIAGFTAAYAMGEIDLPTYVSDIVPPLLGITLRMGINAATTIFAELLGSIAKAPIDTAVVINVSAPPSTQAS